MSNLNDTGPGEPAALAVRAVQAFADQCPHRGARLSLGRVTPEGQLAAPDAIGLTYVELAARSAAMRGGDSEQQRERAQVWLQRFRAKGPQQTQRIPNGRWYEWSEKKTASGRTVGLRIDVTHIKTLQLQSDKARREYQRLVESLADLAPVGQAAHVQLEFADGSVTYRTISGITDAGAYRQATLTAALPGSIPGGSVRTVSMLETVRLDTDDVQVEYRGDWTGRMTLPLVRVAG